MAAAYFTDSVTITAPRMTLAKRKRCLLSPPSSGPSTPLPSAGPKRRCRFHFFPANRSRPPRFTAMPRDGAPASPHKAVRQACERTACVTDQVTCLSTPSSGDSETGAPTDHGLTYSECEPAQKCGSVTRISVTAGDGGMLVQWDSRKGDVLLVPAAIPVVGDWVKAVRLVAKENAGVVLLTLLNMSFRIYVDGLRLARVGSPVAVHPSQLVRFAASPTVYSITSADGSPSAFSAVGVVLCRGRRNLLLPPEMRMQTDAPHMRPAPPLPRVPSPAAQQTTFSSPQETLAESTLFSVRAKSSEQQRLCDDVAVPCVLPHSTAQTLLADGTASTAACDTAESVFPVGGAAKESTGATDLLAEASVGVERHTSDVMESTLVADRNGGRAGGDVEQRVPTPQSGNHLRNAATPAPATQRGQHQQQGPEFLKTLSAWGPVTTVASPDWKDLSALWSDDSNEEDGETSGSESVSGAFVAALQSRREQQQRKKRLCAEQQPVRHREVGGAEVARAASVQGRATPLSAAGTGGSTCGSFDLRSPTNADDRSSLAPRSPRMGSEVSSLFLSDGWMGKVGSDSDDMRASCALGLKAKMRLKQRMAVAPFVVETFGGTHRYRPLMNKPAAVTHDSSDDERGDIGLTPESVLDPIKPMGREESAEAPWDYPPAADELVTPQTEFVLCKEMRWLPESTTAAKNASFIHDALRRTYDAATDRFTYMAFPGLPDLLYRMFMTVSEELMATLESGRPVRRLSSPVLCAGDLFGSFKDVLVVLGSVAHFTHWSMMHHPLVLLGNYVDVGWHSVEVVLLLCSWACLQPSRVHLLRGPHEDPLVNGNYKTLGKRCLRYKCRQRFGARKGVALWARLNRIFALLPVAAVVDSSVFLVHGGVPQLLPSTTETEVNAGYHMQPRRGGTLYSNTSGVPTPTITATEFASSNLSRYADPLWSFSYSAGSSSPSRAWRPPSARHTFSLPTGAYDEPVTRGDEALRGGADGQQNGALRHHAERCGSAVRGARVAAAADGRATGATGKKMAPLPPVTAASAVDTLAGHDGASPPSSFPSSGDGFAGDHGETTSSVRPVDPVMKSSFEFFRRASGDVPPACAALSRYAPLSGPPTADFSYFDECRLAEHSRPHTPLVHLSSGGSAQMAMSSGAPSALVFDAAVSCDSVEAEENSAARSSAPTSALKTVIATSFTAFNDTHAVDAAANQQQHPSDASEARSGMLTEMDFERLLLATSMRDFSFQTLQPTKEPPGSREVAGEDKSMEEDSDARRCRLLRELVWNRPRDAASKVGQSAEKMRVVDGVVQPSWWLPHEVQCCHMCAPVSAEHRCCRVFGCWALVHFLSRFNFSLLVRGAPESTADMYGALLSEEGRLLSLLTCTHLYKRSLQAAACVLQPTSFQLATWGAQELADSCGQSSLSDLRDIRDSRDEHEQFRRFVHEQVQVRVRDHGRVGPGNRWGIASAYSEFQRQRALGTRLGGGKGPL
ncbi:putative protein phosphatase [Leptomonas seymouri]|uniref:Serine/threonine specific protein phosphatases domain-containing protein n=1 Tax=Leptomonas seymouri TaxID=5684 RepID=A0A0N1I9V3_LEPSE|nr:putative protein phosphatase [Leptomonas seymouri]|eukprot:KPI88914.1 putative protein phosphatase [Leptomonas seymouri]